MSYRNYRDLTVWQKAMDLTEEVYRLVKNIPKEETYAEPFGIPQPDELIFIGWYDGGNVFRSGCTFKRGNGKIFYFQPGHESFPIYYDANIQRIIRNAVYWAKPDYRSDDCLTSHWFERPNGKKE